MSILMFDLERRYSKPTPAMSMHATLPRSINITALALFHRQLLTGYERTARSHQATAIEYEIHRKLAADEGTPAELDYVKNLFYGTLRGRRV